MKKIYCHFSFRKPKNADFAYFSIVYVTNGRGILRETVKLPIWGEGQYVLAIQSYSVALANIYKCQRALKNAGFTNIMLVTGNSVLANWITGYKVNKYYDGLIERASRDYRCGACKEIELCVGVCVVSGYEKAYQYCCEKYVCNNDEYEEIIRVKKAYTKIESDGISVEELANSISVSEPETSGIIDI